MDLHVRGNDGGGKYGSPRSRENDGGGKYGSPPSRR